jgi:P4 family phage/plasmid primase-like protien
MVGIRKCASRRIVARTKEAFRIGAPVATRPASQVMTDLPYLAHGPIAQAFAEQTKDFAFLYDRGTFAAWVGTRWSIGDPMDLKLKGAVNSYLNGLYPQYSLPSSTKKVLLDSRFRQGVVDQVKPLLPAWKFAEEFDSDPLLLGVPGNQVLDLRTGLLRTMMREDRVTKRTAIAPDPECKPVRFLRFMQEITQGDDALGAYLLRYCGYVLTGYTREHCLPFWYGHGANGKGTLINVLQHIMGWEYGTALRMSNLAAKKNEDDSQRRIIAKLCGARLATANEGNAQVKLDMALLKSLASSDLLAGAHLYEREFTFLPSHKLIIATNHKPELEVDTAARRRVHLVPFDAEFTGHNEEKGLEDALKKEAPGIMALFVQSCLEWQSIGLAAPERVTRATRQLFEELDPVGRFATERLTEDVDSFLSTEELSAAYATFLHDNDCEGNVDQRTLIGRLVGLPGVNRSVRVSEGVRRRGLTGRKLAVG